KRVGIPLTSVNWSRSATGTWLQRRYGWANDQSNTTRTLSTPLATILSNCDARSMPGAVTGYSGPSTIIPTNPCGTAGAAAAWAGMHAHASTHAHASATVMRVILRDPRGFIGASVETAVPEAHRLPRPSAPPNGPRRTSRPARARRYAAAGRARRRWR